MPGKRVQFDEETWQALDLLARDAMKDFQELADEAFTDLLRKHDRPVGLKAALRRSAGVNNVTPFPREADKQSKGKPKTVAKPRKRAAPKSRS